MLDMKPNDIKAACAFLLNRTGIPIATICHEFKIHPQSLYRAMRRLKLPITVRGPLKKAIEFCGRRFTLRTTGYYAATDGNRQLLHHVVWESVNGQLPDGFEVHHKDENRTNNAVDNLELKTKPDHARHHMAKRRAAGFVPASQWPARSEE